MIRVKMPDGKIEEFPEGTPKEFIKEKALRMKSMSEGALKIKMPDGVVYEFMDNEAGRAEAKATAQGMLDNQQQPEQSEETSLDDLSDRSGLTRTFQQGLSLGFSDEIAGAAGATRGALKEGVNKLANWAGKEGDLLDVTEEDTYTGARDLERRKLKDFSAENPKTALAAEMVGGLGSVGNIVKGAATLGQAAKQGATIGGASGAGFSEEDNLKGVAKDALIGSTVGVVAPAAIGAIGKSGTAVKEGGTFLAEKIGGRSSRIARKEAKERAESGLNELFTQLMPEEGPRKVAMKKSKKEIDKIIAKEWANTGASKTASMVDRLANDIDYKEPISMIPTLASLAVGGADAGAIALIGSPIFKRIFPKTSKATIDVLGGIASGTGKGVEKTGRFVEKILLNEKLPQKYKELLQSGNNLATIGATHQVLLAGDKEYRDLVKDLSKKKGFTPMGNTINKKGTK